MTRPSPIGRLKSSHVVQVLVVYLGASWVVMEVAGELQEVLELPTWVRPVALILLLVGLVVVLATAWVQSHPGVDAQEAAGEVPETWEVGLRDLLSAIRRGKMPHLTWGRVILGGVFAFWLLFGFAGLFVLVGSRGVAPVDSVVAGEAGEGLAIVPWAVSGADPDVYREGMITLLGTTLDAVPGLRAVDSRTVLARWDEAIDREERPDLTEVLDVGRRTGARYVLVGSVVSAGTDLGLVADLYDAPTEGRLGTARAEGPPDSLMALVDRFSVEVARLLLAEDHASTPIRHLSSLTTHSLDALLAYVEGERGFRRADWRAALEAYERAIRRDSTFALAHLRAAQVLGWDEGVNTERGLEHLASAARFADRLPRRELALLDAFRGVWESDPRAIDATEAAVRRYPDDPYLWHALGDLYVHVGQKALRPREQELVALERAHELAPDFAPSLIHMADYELSFGDSARAAEMIRREQDLMPDTMAKFPRGHRTVFRLIYGDSANRAEALTDLEEMEQLGGVLLSLRGPRRLPHREAMWRRLVEAEEENVGYRTNHATALARQGRIEEALARLPASTWQGSRLRAVLFHYGLVPEDSLRDLRWEQASSFGEAYVALLLGDTTTAARARAQFEGELADPDVWNLKFLNGLQALKTAGPSAAEPFLLVMHEDNSGSDQLVFPYLQWMLGDFYEELGEPRKAFAYFRAAAQSEPLAALRAARLAARLEDAGEARRLYQELLIAWEHADPQFAPWLEEARAWLEAVPG